MRRELAIRKVRNPQSNTTVSIPDAALYFEVQSRTIRRWKDEGKLRSGPHRGSITIESGLQWQKKRSRKRPSLLEATLNRENIRLFHRLAGKLARIGPCPHRPKI